MREQHTPTPWEYKNGEIIGPKGSKPFHIQWGDRKTIVRSSMYNDEADLNHIVKCVNLHDDLAKELERAKDELLRRTNIDTDDWGFVQNIENLLNLAKATK